MSLKDQLRTDLKEAMKAGDKKRRTVIRGLMAVIKEAEQRKREDLVSDALEKHDVERPRHLQDPDEKAAYEEAVASAMALENVDERAELDDPEALAIVQKQVKQRQDSIDEAQKAGREDVASKEQEELKILEEYLPRQLTREEIEEEAQALIDEVGAEGMQDMGRVMGPLMEKLKGRADGGMVSEVVRDLLQS